MTHQRTARRWPFPPHSFGKALEPLCLVHLLNVLDAPELEARPLQQSWAVVAHSQAVELGLAGHRKAVGQHGWLRRHADLSLVKHATGEPDADENRPCGTASGSAHPSLPRLGLKQAPPGMHGSWRRSGSTTNNPSYQDW